MLVRVVTGLLADVESLVQVDRCINKIEVWTVSFLKIEYLFSVPRYDTTRFDNYHKH